MAVRGSEVSGWCAALYLGEKIIGRTDMLWQGQSARTDKEGAVNCILDSTGSEVPVEKMGDRLGGRGTRDW